MADARLSRESVEAISQGASDARLSRESVEAISQTVPPFARLSRESIEALVSEAIIVTGDAEFWGIRL